MQIYVEINGSKVTIECEPTDLVEGVKAKIEAATGTAADKQTLSVEIGSVMQELEDGKTLQEYNIEDESTIACEVEAEPEPAKTPVTLEDLATLYDGDILFSVREVVGEEAKENIIISFKSGEHEALKDELLAREVEKYRAEPHVSKLDVKTQCDVVLVIILKGAGGEPAE